MFTRRSTFENDSAAQNSSRTIQNFRQQRQKLSTRHFSAECRATTIENYLQNCELLKFCCEMIMKLAQKINWNFPRRHNIIFDVFYLKDSILERKVGTFFIKNFLVLKIFFNTKKFTLWCGTFYNVYQKLQNYRSTKSAIRTVIVF